jgi:phenylpropionate dioxygenase-like ring-hydroxylating dioxygenase large terminal subunit
MAIDTLLWSWYTDPEIHRREQEHIFRRSWQYVGHVAQVDEPGARFAAAAGDVPVLVVRDEAGRLRAFLNVCRHRGSVLIEGEGRGATIQCSYHAWTYGLDGSLRAAPRADREAQFDASELGLRPLQVDTWGPFVFVNPDLDAPSLAEALGELPELVAQAGLDLDAVRFRERLPYGVQANWKIVAENFLECYHCPVAHREFSAAVETDPDEYRLEAHDGFWSQYCVTKDGEGTGHFHLLWPTFRLNVFPGPVNVSVASLVPEGPERSSGFFDYFFGEDVSDGEARELLAFDDRVGREDRGLVESVQRGVRSGLLERGRLLPRSEQLVAGFQRRIAATISDS